MSQENNNQEVFWMARGYKVIFDKWFSKPDDETFTRVKVLDKKNLPILCADYTKVEPCQGIAEEYAECADIMKFAGLYGDDAKKAVEG